MKHVECICQLTRQKVGPGPRCERCDDTGVLTVDDTVKPVSYVDTCIESAYGSTYRLPFVIRVF